IRVGPAVRNDPGARLDHFAPTLVYPGRQGERSWPIWLDHLLQEFAEPGHICPGRRFDQEQQVEPAALPNSFMRAVVLIQERIDDLAITNQQGPPRTGLFVEDRRRAGAIDPG